MFDYQRLTTMELLTMLESWYVYIYTHVCMYVCMYVYIIIDYCYYIVIILIIMYYVL